MNYSLTDKQMMRQSVENLKVHRDWLVAEATRVGELAAEAGSKFGKIYLKRKRDHLQLLRQQYFTINMTQHPNLIIAQLAGLIGEERIVRDDIKLYEHPENIKKSLDEELATCDSIIRDKEEERRFVRS